MPRISIERMSEGVNTTYSSCFKKWKFITDTYMISIFQLIGKLNDRQKSNIKILIITILEGIICELGSWQVLGELVE